jgi:hypothetical protein
MRPSHRNMREYLTLSPVHKSQIDCYLRQTDDALPFRTTLSAEYALLLAAPPYGLGLSEDDVRRVAEMSLQSRFKVLKGTS